MKRRFKVRKRREAIDIDITSLLDILTILLVFLLKSYNASDLKLDLNKNLNMAESKARELTTLAPVVQVNNEFKVFLNNKEIGRLPASGNMVSLTNSLKFIKNEIETKNRSAKQKQNSSLINLVFDKDMNYALVQRVMHDSSLAGFSEFKFIVKGAN